MSLLPPFAALMTPLLFFVDSRDQFELPKITFLAVTGILAFALTLSLKGLPRLTPLSVSLLALFTIQAAASLPGVSLSWRTSLLGDYENFSGLFTTACYLFWFFSLSVLLTDRLIGKTLFFAVLSAVLSALYALGQHYGFDFVTWNPETVIGNRDFAALGNPNFLAAYLAMSIPLALCVAGRNAHDPKPAPLVPGYVLFTTFFILGLAFLFSGTTRGAAFLGQDPTDPPVGYAIVFGWTFLCAAMVRHGRLGNGFPLSLTLAVLGLGLVRTGSRGGVLGAVIALFVLILLTWFDRDLRSRALAWAGRFHPVLRYGLPLGVTALALGFNPAILDRLSGTVLHFTDSLATSRLHIWKPALRMVQENPLLGVGLDTFKIAFPAFSGYEFNRIDGIFVSSRTAHNEWLQAAATTGLLGLVAQLAVLILFLLALRTAWRSAGPRHRWTLTGLLSCVAAYQAQNLFSFGVAAINFLWFFSLAAVVALSRSASLPASRPSLPRSIPSIVLVLLISVPSLVRLTADGAFGRGSSSIEYVKVAGEKLSAKERTLYTEYGYVMNKRAVQLMPLEVKYRLYLGLASERKAEMDPEKARAHFEEAMVHYDRSLEMSPYNAYYHNNRERISLALWGATRDPRHLEAAEEAGRRAVELAPGSPFFKVQWAVALLKGGKDAEASRVLGESFGLSPDFSAKALAQLALDDYLRGDHVFAVRLLNEAVRGNTLSAEAYQYRGLVFQQMGRTTDALKDLARARELKKLTSDAK